MILHIDQIQIKRVTDRDKLSVDGIFYISLGNVCFPEYQWFDLISIDFENWIPQLISFADGHTNSCLLTFMDGPYHIKLLRCSSNMITAVCVENQKEVGEPTEIDLSKFLLSVAKCINKFATAIYQNDTEQLFETEISRLGLLSKKLRAYTKRGTDCHASVRTGSQ